MQTNKEIIFDSSSYVDPNGRVFHYNGEIYRLINKESICFVKQLFDNGIVHKLVSDRLLVDTTISKEVFAGHDLVLHHRRIDKASYCIEWPFYLLKKAAVHTLKLNLELLSSDMYLQDAYPWNIFYEGTQPVFIDFTSIVRSEPHALWPAYQQFCQFFLFPLYLYSNKQGKVTRALLRDYLHGINYLDFEKLIPLSFKLTHPMCYLKRIVPEKLGKIANSSELINSKVVTTSKNIYKNDSKLKSDRLSFFKDLLSDIESIKIPHSITRWTNYYDNEAKELNSKLILISKVVGRLRPVTVLDVGCNAGEFSIIAAETGASVIAIDSDESCVERLAQLVDKRNLNILPLVMDFSNPTPAFGWGTQQFPSAPTRFKSEMVMALALVHHLIFHQRQNFERVIEALKQYLGKWLIIEFIDISDSYIQRWTIPFEKYDWYTRNNFEKTLNNNFQHVECVGSVTDTRHMYVCMI